MSDRILLTMLNAMGDLDIRKACARMKEWNIGVLDLKDCIFGKAVEKLSPEDAEQMAALAREYGMWVHTLSSCIFSGDVEEGEEKFQERYAGQIENIVEAAKILKPKMIRLLAAQSSRRSEFTNCAQYLAQQHPWAIRAYQDAVDKISDAGFQVTIENEVHRCIFSNPQEILDFFQLLNRPKEKVCCTWDIQNLWQMGTFPTLEVYRQLRPVIGMIHLKGGKAETPGGPLKWQAYLEDASWPVLDILRAIIADGASPVICLNPSHGGASPDYKGDTQRELDFLRREIPEID